jgi:hypothetical protein
MERCEPNGMTIHSAVLALLPAESRGTGAYWFNWTTSDEVEWRNNYRLWMAFVNEYKNRGGRVTTGSDSGFIFKLYGFDYIPSSSCCRRQVFTRSK